MRIDSRFFPSKNKRESIRNFSLACDILYLSHEVQPASEKNQSSHCQASALTKRPDNLKTSAEAAKNCEESPDAA